MLNQHTHTHIYNPAGDLDIPIVTHARPASYSLFLNLTKGPKFEQVNKFESVVIEDTLRMRETYLNKYTLRHVTRTNL